MMKLSILRNQYPANLMFFTLCIGLLASSGAFGATIEMCREISASSQEHAGTQIKFSELTKEMVAQQNLKTAESSGDKIAGAAKSAASQGQTGFSIDSATLKTVLPALEKCHSTCQAVASDPTEDVTAAAKAEAQSLALTCKANAETVVGLIGSSGISNTMLAMGALAVVGAVTAIASNKSGGGGAGPAGNPDINAPKDKDGNVICSQLREPHKHPDCEDLFVRSCIENPERQKCSEFSDLFCGIGEQEQAEGNRFAENGSSQFCQVQIGTRFCETEGREKCPTCMELSERFSPHCASNPAACNAQMSLQQLRLGQLRCPMDPKFTNPDLVAKLKELRGTASVNLFDPEASGEVLVTDLNDTIRRYCEKGQLEDCSTQANR